MANQYAPIVVTPEDGARFVAQVRSHRVTVDQPQPRGGDTAPMPIEMLGVSLGTCIAHYVQEYCRARAIGTEGLRVEVEATGVKAPSRVEAFSVRVIPPAGLDAAQLEALERVARSCPAHNTLTMSATVAVRLDVPETAGR